MLNKENVISITDHLMKEPKLLTIKLKLINNETVIIHHEASDKYKTVAHEDFLEVITKQGNYASDVFIPYDNILRVVGEIYD